MATAALASCLALSATASEPIPLSVVIPPSTNRLPTAARAAQFPGGCEFDLQPPSTSDWIHAAGLAFDLALPPDGPTNAQVLVFMQDWDHLWYQNLWSGRLRPGRSTRVHADLSPGSSAWKPVGHYATWHLRALMKPRRFGVRVFTREPFSGDIRLSAASAARRVESGPPFIRNLQPNAAEVPVYGRFELTFDLPDRYPDPFDAAEVRVSAEFTAPGGRATTVEGYYGRHYYRESGPTGERIHPQGPPYWRVRFTPSGEGVHTYRLTVRDRLGTSSGGPATFRATPAASPGFVRVSRKDPRFFEFDSGAFFFPIGHNLRSPFDTRADKQFPWKQRWPEGSLAYTRYFRDMARHGETLAEIWSCAWSLGLEWGEDRPGYHGIGQYNLANAWELDRVFEEAERHGIRINYVVHNHGKFGTFYDHEWELNPFNVLNGGYLKTPEEYFSDPRALDAFRKLMRYTLSRWSHSTSLFGWEFWSELNLTGSNQNESNYRRPEVVQWHKLMGAEIKAMDPYRHPIGTHVSGDFSRQNKDIISLPEMDYCPVDAYHHSADPIHIVDLLRRTAEFNNPYGKPVLVTEFGGSPMAAHVKHLEDALHAGLWSSTSIPLGGTPMFWWWQIIEEENFYPRFAAIDRFMKGEDRRNPDLRMAQPELIPNPDRPQDIAIQCLKTDTRALGWIYRRQAFETIDPVGKPTVSNLSFRIRDLQAGPYTVEFWDTLAGECRLTNTLSTLDTQLPIAAPPFPRDLAFKLYRTPPATPPF